MKTNFRRIACTVLTILCIFAFTGCGNSEPAARAVAEGFMNAVVDLDLATAVTYVDDESMMDKALFESFDIEKLMDDAISSDSGAQLEPYMDKFKPLLEDMIAKVKDCLSYEITGVEKDGANYVYNVNITLPDDSVDLEKKVEESITNSISQEEMMNLMTSMLTSGKISLNSSQEDIIGVVFDEILPKITEAVQNIEFETTTQEQKLVVTKTDGQWHINVVESALN